MNTFNNLFSLKNSTSYKRNLDKMKKIINEIHSNNPEFLILPEDYDTLNDKLSFYNVYNDLEWQEFFEKEFGFSFSKLIHNLDDVIFYKELNIETLFVNVKNTEYIIDELNNFLECYQVSINYDKDYFPLLKTFVLCSKLIKNSETQKFHFKLTKTNDIVEYFITIFKIELNQNKNKYSQDQIDKLLKIQNLLELKVISNVA